MSDSWAASLIEFNGEEDIGLISGLIIDYVEHILPSVLTDMEIPPIEVFRAKSRRYKLRSARMKKKRRTQELDRLKSKSALSQWLVDMKQRIGREMEGTALIHSLTSDERAATLARGPQYKLLPDSAERKKELRLLETPQQMRRASEEEMAVRTSTEELMDLMSPERQREILANLEESIETRRALSLNDISRIRDIVSHSEKEKNIRQAHSLLIKYSDAIREESGIDFFKELYRYDEQLPKALRTRKPKTISTEESLEEVVKAILLYQYDRLNDQARSQFLDGEITYDQYLGKIRNHTRIARELCPP